MSRIGMGNALSAAYSAMPLRGVMPAPPATSTAGRVSCRTKSPMGPKTRTSSSGRRAAKARLYGESERRTAYSRWGRVGLVARDMGRASMPSSVCSCRNVNCVGRNVKPAGFSGSIARVLGVSAREDTIRVRKPRGGPANASTSDVPWGRNATAVFRDSDHEKASRVRERTYFFISASARPVEFFAGHVFLLGGDPPRVAERVLHARGPVSVERVHRLPEGGRTGFEGPSVRRVGVRHVEEQWHLDRLPVPDRVAQLDDRVPDGDFRVDDPAGRIREAFPFPGAEGLLQEIDQ